MEPVTTAILAALGKLGEKAVGQAYSSLKSKLTEKFGDDSDVSVAVDALEKDPESAARKAVLDEQVTKLNLEQDEEIQQAISTLNQHTDSQTNIDISIGGNATVQGVVGAENVSVNDMSFGSTK